MAETTTQTVQDEAAEFPREKSAIRLPSTSIPENTRSPQIPSTPTVHPPSSPIQPINVKEGRTRAASNPEDIVLPAPPSETELKEARHYWGNLFEPDNRCTESLNQLLTALAKYISSNFYPHDHNDLTPAQLAAFYKAVGGDYDILFLQTPPNAITYIYQSLGCLHSLQPEGKSDGFAPPIVPALKPRGFITWQTIQLLLGPAEHVPFLQNALQQFDIIDPFSGSPFPKILPTDCFPQKPDPEMTKWYEDVSQRLSREPHLEDQRKRPHRQLPVRKDIGVSPESSGDDRAEAVRYFANPLYRDTGGRPSIVRRSSKTSTVRKPVAFVKDRGRAAISSVRHFWNPNLHPQAGPHGRRRSWHYPDDTNSEDEHGIPTAQVHRRATKRPVRVGPGRSPSPSSASDTSSRINPQQMRPRPTLSAGTHSRQRVSPRISSPSRRSSTSNPPSMHARRVSNDATSPLPPRDYFQSHEFDEPVRRRHSSTVAGSGNRTTPPAGFEGGIKPSGFTPSTGAPFAARVAKLQTESNTSSGSNGNERDRDRYERERTHDPRRNVSYDKLARERPAVSGVRQVRGTSSEKAPRSSRYSGRQGRDLDDYEDDVRRSHSSDARYERRDRRDRDHERERERERERYRERERERDHNNRDREHVRHRDRDSDQDEKSEHRKRRTKHDQGVSSTGVDGRRYPDY